MLTFVEKVGRILESRKFWTVTTTILFGIMAVVGIFCTIPHPERLNFKINSLIDLGYFIVLCLFVAGYSMWVFYRGNEQDWYYAWQMVAFLFPVVIITYLYALSLGQMAIFYFSGFIWISEWLLFKWIYITIPDE